MKLTKAMRMISKMGLSFIVLFLILIFLSLHSFYVYKKGSLSERVCFQENCFSVEIANTPPKRAQGLMFRKKLDEDKGMFFIFPKQGNYNFWMKNTLISLDIIWIDQEGKIVFIKRNVLPCKENPCKSIKPDVLAKYVLEINAGKAKAIDLKIGDKLSFNF